MEMIYYEQLNIRRLFNSMENPREMTNIYNDYLCKFIKKRSLFDSKPSVLLFE
jgi:endonuclease III